MINCKGLLLRAIGCMVYAFIAGCGTPLERAPQLDMRGIYVDTIKQKYSGDGFASRFKAYENLKQQKSVVEAQLRAVDDERRVKLNESIVKMGADMAERQAKIDFINKDLDDVKLRVAGLEKQKSDLSQKKNDPSAEARTASIEGKLVELKLRAAENGSAVAMVSSDYERIKAVRQDAVDQVAALKSKTYPGIEDECKLIRSGVVNDLLAVADTNYLTFKDGLMAGRASYDTVLDITELALSTATALVGGVTAKTNLGSSSTLLKGSRSTVDKNFFAQQTIASILNAIEDQQQKDKAVILLGLTKPTDEYSLNQAFSDVQLYESRASLVSGALLVANQTASSARLSKIALDKVKIDPAKASLPQQ